MNVTDTTRLIALVGIATFLWAGCGPDTATENIPNRPPTIQGVNAEKTPLAPAESTRVYVGATDPDLATDQESSSDDTGGDARPGVDGLDYRWSVEDDAWSVESAGAAATLTAPDSYDSQTTLTVEVVDEAGASDTATLNVQTEANQAPYIQNIDASPNPVSAGETTTLTAEAADERGDELTFNWEAPDGWSLGSPTGAEVDLTAPDEDGVVGQIELEVTDPGGKAATSSIQVETPADEAPDVASLSATPPQVEPGGTTTVDVDASDPDGGELEYAWSAPDGWSINEMGASADVTAPDDYGADATVTVTVSDRRDNETTASVVVSTFENDGPRINSFTADPEQVERGGTVDLNVGATDPNGDTLSYQWSLPSNSDWQLDAKNATATLQAPDKPRQTVTVDVTVFDESGKGVQTSKVVSTKANNGPDVGSIVATPTEMPAGGTATLRATASDPDGDSLGYDWQAPSGWTINGMGREVTVQAPDKDGENALVELKVTDAFGADATGTVAVRTAPNRGPTISNVTANPSVLSTGATSTVEVDASDPNGDSLNYTWTVPSGWTQNGSGSQIQVTAPDQFGSQALVEVTVEDGSGHSVTGSVGLETSRNQPPVISTLKTDNSNWVERDGRANLTAKAFDPDGQSISYKWSAPSGWSIVGQGARVVLETPDKNEESATITLVVTDDEGATATKTLSVRTRDTEPAAFAFNDKNNVQPNSKVTSNSVTLGDFEGKLEANCSDCEVSVNGGSFSGTVGGIEAGDSIRLRTTAGVYGKTVTATVTVGDTTSDPWSVTSKNWQGKRKFSTCGQKKGRNGPSQSACDSAYNGTNLQGNVEVNGGIQVWTVPADGTYRIEAAGAEGGSGHSNGGGRGARMRGDFKLNAGDKIQIVVGQMGTIYNDTRAAGGGGSFVVLSDGTKPLLVAGGGGGMTDNSLDGNNHGTTKVDGRDASPGGNNSSNYSYGGKNGEGGTKGSGSGGSAGCGGGFKTDGWKGAHTHGKGGGKAFKNGAKGGYNPDENSEGGFGGGGGGGNHGGGGGGGYSGGGGHWHYPGGGGGGGSYNDGSNQDNQSGDNSGPGWVHIDFQG